MVVVKVNASGGVCLFKMAEIFDMIKWNTIFVLIFQQFVAQHS